MTHTHSLPDLDEMLQSLLLYEEGEHEFEAEGDVVELRQLFFPVTQSCIYFNHATQGALPRPVVRSMHEYLDDASNFGGAHEQRWLQYIAGTRRRLASLMGARADRVALTASISDGMQLIANHLTWSEGDSILVAEGEFPSNVYPWLNLQQQGVKVEFVPTSQQRILPEELFARITERTRLVSLSLVEFSTGFRNDIQSIASHCHERGIICGIDAMQALGAIDVHVGDLGIDYLTGGSHKWLLSPKRCGFLYVADDLLARLDTQRKGWYSVENPFDFFNYQQPLKAGAQRLEYSYPNAMPVLGLDAALGLFEGIEGGMQAIEERILGLTAHLGTGLQQLGYPLISPMGENERSGIVCFEPHPTQPERNAEHLVQQLAAHNIYVAARGNGIRVSPHFYNTPEEIDTLLNILSDLKQTADTEG